MSEEYKNFNDYEKSEPDEAPAKETAPVIEESTEEVPAPDPNPPTGWAPGHDEDTAPVVSKSSPMGVTAIILSFAGYCTYGIASFVGIFLGAKAYRRNKNDVAAKIGLTACILMTIFWLATIAFYIFTPTGREMLAEIMKSVEDSMNELYSGSDIYYTLFK